MRRLSRWAVTTAGHQVRNLLSLAKGRPLTVPALWATSVDMSDVKVAEHWLHDRSRWRDDEVRRAYEAEFAAFNESRAAFAFAAGRVALSACLHALALSPGAEVVVPAYTCVVVDNAIRFAGLVPVYADIELDTFGLSAESLETVITDRTRAIIVQHLYGLISRDYDAVMEIAHSRHLRVIEDCAHATGARYCDRRAGARGDLAFYSSERSKVMSTIEGGVATTDDEQLAARLQSYADSAAVTDDHRVESILRNVILDYCEHRAPQRWWLGDVARLQHGEARITSTSLAEVDRRRPATYGRKMANAVAALGLTQIRKLDRVNADRRRWAARWDSWCDRRGYRKPLVIPESEPVFLRYPVLVDPEEKRDLSWAMRELGVRPGVWFTSNLHPAPAFISGCPNAQRAVEQCINMPVAPTP